MSIFSLIQKAISLVGVVGDDNKLFELALDFKLDLPDGYEVIKEFPLPVIEDDYFLIDIKLFGQVSKFAICLK